MKREEILTVIIDIVGQMQGQSGRDVPDLSGDTHLIGDVPGCDSLILVELSILLTDALSEVLGEREIPDCLLTGLKPNAHPTLDEMAASIEKFLAGAKAKSPRSGSKSAFKKDSSPNAAQPDAATDLASSRLLGNEEMRGNEIEPLPSLHHTQPLEENEDEHHTR